MSGIAIGLFFALGLVLSVVGNIWGLTQAFREEYLWGVLYLLVPFAGLFFYIKNWSNPKIRKTFFMQLVVVPMYLFAGFQFVSSLASSFGPMLGMVQPGASEQSPSSFPSDFNAGASPSQEQSPASEPSFGTVGGQQYDFNQSMQLGKIAYAKGDYQTALINFNRAVQANPGDAEALKGVADTKKAIAGSQTK
ncbi:MULTISPECIES: hypothetical protein [unclassified Microcoleus]|uniref:hypothetical protein n=1 Tax=unclassified Microcoleus TaxID=2642155 RepID=UPI0025CC34D2|nr:MULTISPECIES: hypothetical protein [unclassified Microcoleus]